MKGSIRIALGLFVTFGAVGHMDADPTANVAVQFVLALAGLAVMYAGVCAMKGSQ